MISHLRLSLARYRKDKTTLEFAHMASMLNSCLDLPLLCLESEQQ